MKVNLLLIPWLLLSLFSFCLWVEEVLHHQQVILLCLHHCTPLHLVQDHHMVCHLWPTRTWVVGKHVRVLIWRTIWIIWITFRYCLFIIRIMYRFYLVYTDIMQIVWSIRILTFHVDGVLVAAPLVDLAGCFTGVGHSPRATFSAFFLCLSSSFCFSTSAMSFSVCCFSLLPLLSPTQSEKNEKDIMLKAFDMTQNEQ